MAVPWVLIAVLAGVVGSRWAVSNPPVPAPLPAVDQPDVMLPPALAAAAGHPIALGERILLRTTQGDITLVLFPAEAPTYTRHFLQEVNWGTFRSEGFWRTDPGRYVRLGGPDTDVDTGSGTYDYTLMPHSFDANRLPQVAGSLVMDRRFEEAGGTPERFVRNQYAIVTGDGGYYPGVVIGQVIAGLDVAQRLRPGEAILYAVNLTGPEAMVSAP